MKLALLILLFGALAVQATPVRSGKVEAELVSDVRAILPGHTLTVALRLKANPNWHTYWSNPGESGMPTTIKWTLPDGFRAGALQFPVPHRFEGSGLVGFGYEEEVFLFTEITVPEKLTDNQITLSARASWLACDPAQCLPGRVQLSLTLPVATADPKPSKWSRILTSARKKIPRELADATAKVVQENATWVITLQLPKKLQPSPSDPQFFPENPKFADLKSPPQFKEIKGGFEIRVPISEDVAELANPVRFLFAGMERPLLFSAKVAATKLK
jgi:DsbC/DsbD-like thiol-disulfide interchange protein